MTKGKGGGNKKKEVKNNTRIKPNTKNQEDKFRKRKEYNHSSSAIHERKRPKRQGSDNKEDNKEDNKKKKENEEYIPTGPLSRVVERTKVIIDKSKAQEEAIKEAEVQTEKVEVLLPESVGLIEAEEGERTSRLTQQEIASAVDIRASRKAFDLKMDTFGPYSIDYTRNGRYLVMAGAKGHIAALDWNSKKLVVEFNVKDPIRDIKFLHNESFIAVAQKRFAYIYDSQGVELHCLKNHEDITHLEFLPYHFLLVSSSNRGKLVYQDTSTGDLVTKIDCKAGPLRVMCQNSRNAIIHLGHSSGIASLWSPNSKEPLVKMVCHKGPVRAIAVDIMGQYLYFVIEMVTTGQDSHVRVWDLRTYGRLHSFKSTTPIDNLDFSQLGLLALSSRNSVQVYKSTNFDTPENKQPYLTHKTRTEYVHDIKFCPYEDILGVGHSQGFSSLLIPGSGEPNYDSLEADPFATNRYTREVEVKALLEKIPANMIMLDPDEIGKVVDPEPWKHKEQKIVHPGLLNIKRRDKPLSTEQHNIVGREKRREEVAAKQAADKEKLAQLLEKKRTGTVLDRFLPKTL